MDYEMVHQPSFAELELMLDDGDAVRTEAGSMVSYSGPMNVATEAGTDGEDVAAEGGDVAVEGGDAGTEGGNVAVEGGDVAVEGGETGRGFLEALKRTALDEPFAVNAFEADGPAKLTLAPPLPGDLFNYELRGESLFVQSSSFLAAEADVDFDAAFDDERSFFGGEGLFLLELSGAGLVFLSSYGAISVVSLDSGERHVVDTGHVVAFEDSVDVDVQRVDGLTSAMDDEGLVCEFEGPGNIWRQSRSPDAFLAWLAPNLPDE